VSAVSHPRLAQILGEIEARCAAYKHDSLVDAQRWADENWELGESPLIDLVRKGVLYCQLNGMDQTVGFELNKLGASVNNWSSITITESIARNELYGAVFVLHDYVDTALTVIDGQVAACQHATDVNQQLPSDEITSEDIAAVLQLDPKTVQNRVGDWPTVNGNRRPKVFSYADVRPLIISGWRAKAGDFPELYRDFQRILNERRQSKKKLGPTTGN
jgi:hypothetical protein